MSLCGNRSPITGECIIGCPGFGGCKRGTETPAPAFVRWEAAPDPRTRPLHGAVPPVGDPFSDVEPPRNLGRFNCRGDYVVPQPRRAPSAWPQDVTVPPPPMRGRMVIYTPPPPELPEGLWERDGVLMCECRVCERAMPAECEPEDFDPSMAYCGGSPRCCP